MSGWQEISAQFYGNRLLFGDPDQRGIVAVEIASRTEVEIFRREGESIARERRPIQLFAVVENPEVMRGFKAAHQVTELKGDFRFRHLVTLASTEALEALKKHLKNATGKTSGSPEAPYLLLTDSVEQYLMLSGMTHFIGMEFAQLRRLQLHLETYISAGFEFASAAREGDRIVAIAIADNRGFEHVIRGDVMDERAMLAELVRLVAERDPDVIEGHNLFRANLEYLEARARRLGVKLAFGRDGSVMYARPARLQIAERTIAYRRFEAYGRNLVDTWILAQHYDIGSRELESFELRDLAKHLRVTREGRVYLELRSTSHYFDNDREALFQSALEEVRETRDVAEALSASYFVQAQIFPYSYQNAILRGNATKIDALMLRAYLAAHHSIPGCGEPKAFAGGYTEMRRCGVARNVFHCDVTSLYPSMMLEFGHAPASDALGVFLKMLSDLRSFRIKAKALARELSGSARRNIEALQQTFKILINSFYGYLGFSMGHFNDFAQASAVTQRGRDLIQSAINELEQRGAKVIECDTDGIYFVLPNDSDSDSEADTMLAEIAATMPAGIKLEIDGKYAAMFSYKMKNYVLLEASGEMTIRGSGLKSRGLERFQRRFMEEMFLLLMTERRAELQNLFAGYLAKIAAHEIGIDALMKTETLQDSLDNYREKVGGKRRNAAAAYELALKSSRAYVAGDQISYYVSGRGPKVKVATAARLIGEYDATRPDENIEYYQAKLTDLFEKFSIFVTRAGLFAVSELDTTDAEGGDPSQAEFFSAPEK